MFICSVCLSLFSPTPPINSFFPVFFPIHTWIIKNCYRTCTERKTFCSKGENRCRHMHLHTTVAIGVAKKKRAKTKREQNEKHRQYMAVVRPLTMWVAAIVHTAAAATALARSHHSMSASYVFWSMQFHRSTESISSWIVNFVCFFFVSLRLFFVCFYAIS